MAEMPVYYGTGTSAQVWTDWVGSNITTDSTTITQIVWDNWQTGTVTYTPQTYATLTPEQVAAREAQRVERERVAAEAAAARKVAADKALALLRESLDERQRQEYERDGCFHVETRDGTRRYRLAPGSQPRRVAGEDGRGYAYCIHPDHGYPEGDTVLAQKLLLETDEEAFLRIANARVVALA